MYMRREFQNQAAAPPPHQDMRGCWRGKGCWEKEAVVAGLRGFSAN